MFDCVLCTDSRMEIERATFKCTHAASNVYAHFKAKHIELYGILDPIIRSREMNKRSHTQYTTLEDVLVRYRKKNFDEALLCLFSSPDLLKLLFETWRFK